MAAPGTEYWDRLRKEPADYRRISSRIFIACNYLIERCPRIIRQRNTQIIFDGCAAALAVFVAYQVRFDFQLPRSWNPGMWTWAVLMGFLRPASIAALTGYRTIWRFLRIQDVGYLVLAALPPSLFLLTLRLLLPHLLIFPAIPVGAIALDFGVFVSLAVTARAFRRLVYEGSRPVSESKRTLLLGSEDCLAGALGQVRSLPELRVVGLVAPGRHLLGREIGRIPVVGGPGDLGWLLATGSFDVVLIADATLDCIAETVSLASHFGTNVRLLPSAANVMRGEVRVAAPVDAEKAFRSGRMLVPAADAVADIYRDRTVLITGAGGSIGSELCRQVSTLQVSRLLLLDKDENAVFELEREMQPLGLELVPLIGDIRDVGLLRTVFAEYRPQIVLHAAAYKHVPLMESNPCQAVLNNVLGTRVLAETAIEFSTERFVMISTDKAVRPTSVMGASKRVAEMVIQSRADWGDTRFACVRFGNVVGSRGSVIPIFEKQIAEGEPITITDERMSRYFMTIKEAVQLVLQASSLAADGEIYILDMGDPVMITTLAHRLIEMSGLRPGKDVDVEIVGIRPGEKLEESLYADQSSVGSTQFPLVHRVQAEEIPEDFEIRLAELEGIAVEGHNSEVLTKLRLFPIEYEIESRYPRNQQRLARVQGT